MSGSGQWGFPDLGTTVVQVSVCATCAILRIVIDAAAAEPTITYMSIGCIAISFTRVYIRTIHEYHFWIPRVVFVYNLNNLDVILYLYIMKKIQNPVIMSALLSTALLFGILFHLNENDFQLASVVKGKSNSDLL